MDKIIKAWDGAAGPTGAATCWRASAAVAAAATAICINMVLDAVFCVWQQSNSLCVGWVGNEEGFIEWRARRAGDDVFLARSILARGHPDRMRHAIVGGDHGDRHRSSNHVAA